MTTIMIGNHQVTYTVLYSKRRKTSQLKIINTQTLELTVPYFTGEAYIKQLLADKSGWIIKKISALAKIDNNPINKSFCNGAQVLYLGHPYTLSLLPDKIEHPFIILDTHHILIRFPQQMDEKSVVLKYVLKDWFIKNASKILEEKTRYWSDVIGVLPKTIRIKEQKTRWGSCSSLGAINYNWRIIMSPPSVVDYLVIHELCHLRFLNHSINFWNLVKQFTPNYKEHRAWLRANGKLLAGFI